MADADSERLHALDAVRAFALLAGVAFHSLIPWIAGFPDNNGGIPEEPNSAAAAILYFLHMFRMPVFFLIAGYFGHLLLERRGTKAFVIDRAKRIALPLALGCVVFPLATVFAFGLASLIWGTSISELMALWQKTTQQQQQHAGGKTSLQFGHLWFLYYLIMFYAVALAGRAVMTPRIKDGIDNGLRFLMRTGLAVPILGLPIAGFYVFLWHDWPSWTGLPTPHSVAPHLPTFLTFVVFFGIGWLMRRQNDLLLQLRERWVPYSVAAIASATVAYLIAGPIPQWSAYLSGARLHMYAVAYLLGVWCAVFAALGLAQRFLCNPSPARRYFADASYWIYLAHLTVIVFILQLLHPLNWHWSVKYVMTLGFSIPVLLLSYRLLVRHTFIGAVLNGRRYPREVGSPSDAATMPVSQGNAGPRTDNRVDWRPASPALGRATTGRKPFH